MWQCRTFSKIGRHYRVQARPKTDNFVLWNLPPRLAAELIKEIGGAGGDKAGSALGALGGLFGGGKSTTTNSTPGTTNASPAAGLLNLFKKSK